MNEEQRKIKERFEQKQREEVRKTIKQQRVSTKKVKRLNFSALIVEIRTRKNEGIISVFFITLFWAGREQQKAISEHFQAHEATLKQIQEDRERQKLMRPAHASTEPPPPPPATESATPQPKEEQNTASTALLQVCFLPRS